MAIESKNILDKKIISIDEIVFYCPVCKPLWFNDFHSLSKHIFNTHIFVIQKLLDDYSKQHKAIAKKNVNDKWMI